jgi:hypothetical protein
MIRTISANAPAFAGGARLCGLGGVNAWQRTKRAAHPMLMVDTAATRQPRKEPT